MKNFDRRSFIQKSVLGLAGTVAAASGLMSFSFNPSSNAMIDMVKLREAMVKNPEQALPEVLFYQSSN